MLTQEQVASLKPGDRIIISGLSDDWGQYNGMELIVDDPPTWTSVFKGLYVHCQPIYISTSIYEGRIAYHDPGHLSLPAETKSKLCTCPRWDVVNFGCKCGGS